MRASAKHHEYKWNQVVQTWADSAQSKLHEDKVSKVSTFYLNNTLKTLTT